MVDGWTRRSCLVLLGVAAFAAMLLPSGCEEPAPPPGPQTRPARTSHNDAYIAALAVADEFCHAWMRRDEAAGRSLLTRRFVMQYPDRQIRDAIVGEANPRHAAFEITGGKKVTEGRYQFSVRLFFRYAGMHGDRIESPRDRIVVALREDGSWGVDEFPVPQTRSSIR